MGYFLTTVNAVVPLCLIIFTGILLRRLGVLDAGASGVLNRLAYKLLLPCLVFKNIFLAEAFTREYAAYLLFASAGYLLSLLAFWILVWAVEKDPAKRGVMIQGGLHNSYLVIGLALAENLYPNINYGPIAVLASAAIILNNLMSPLVLQYFQGGRQNFREILKGLAVNPPLLAAVSALLARLIRLPLPQVLLSACGSLANAATPVCLLALGSAFEFSTVTVKARQIALPCFVKLAGMAMIFLPLAVMLGYNRLYLLGLLIFFSSPTSPITYTLTCAIGGDRELAAQIVVWSNYAAAAALFVQVFVLIAGGYL